MSREGRRFLLVLLVVNAVPLVYLVAVGGLALNVVSVVPVRTVVAVSLITLGIVRLVRPRHPRVGGSMRAGLAGFTGVAHRLELVAERQGVRWYNDSIATAPERSMAAIRSFEEPIVLMLGGRDKDLPWEDLMKLASERVDHVVLFGEAAEKIEKTVNSLGLVKKRFTILRADHLHAAVLKAAEVAGENEIVIVLFDLCRMMFTV